MAQSPSPMQCVDCNSNFQSPQALAQHCMAKLHNSHSCCQICVWPFDGPKALEAHKNSVHKSQPSCQKCFKTFSSLDALRGHITDVHDCYCHKCIKLFGSAEALEAHTRAVHRTERYCQKCARLFSTPEDFQHHANTVHAEYPCHECPRSFGGVDALRAHTNALHATQSNPIQTPDYPCQNCPRRFGSPGELQAHTKDVHNPSSIAKPLPPIEPRTTTHPPPLRCRGNEYTRLTPSEQLILHTKLLTKCHPPETLIKAGYFLDPSQIRKGEEKQEDDIRENSPPPPYESPITPFSSLSSSPLSSSQTKPYQARSTCLAVSLNCEMAGCASGDEEPIKLTIVNLLTGETLTDSLIHPAPDVVISDWRTDIHGISASVIAAAAAAKNRDHIGGGRGGTLKSPKAPARALPILLGGWRAANEELLRHVDPHDTIIVGQSLGRHLRALRFPVIVSGSCARIVDTAVIARDAVFPGCRKKDESDDDEEDKNKKKKSKKNNKKGKMWGLQELCLGMLGMRIRRDVYSSAEMEGKEPVTAETTTTRRDGLEDALAVREVAIWCLGQGGEERLERWAKKEKKVFWGIGKPQGLLDLGTKGGKGKKNNDQGKGGGGGNRRTTRNLFGGSGIGVGRYPFWAVEDSDYDEEEEGPLRFRDVVDYDMWPEGKSDDSW